ncbi:MAG: CHAT domain-containing protein [Flavobacteriales bacterium]|nr:CHAT domain-containing protein [Flavobacteriales bacterium]
MAVRASRLNGCLFGILAFTTGHAQGDGIWCDRDSVEQFIGGFVKYEAGRPERVEAAYLHFRQCIRDDSPPIDHHFLVQLGVAYLHAQGTFDQSLFDTLWTMAGTRNDGYGMALLVYQRAVIQKKSRLERGLAFVAALDHLARSDSSESWMAAKLEANVAVYRVSYGLEGDWKPAHEEAMRLFLRNKDPATAVDHAVRLSERLAVKGDTEQAFLLADQAMAICAENDELDRPMALKAKGMVEWSAGKNATALATWKNAAELCLDQERSGKYCKDCGDILGNYLHMNGVGEDDIALMSTYLPALHRFVEDGDGTEQCFYLLMQAEYAVARGHAHAALTYAQWADACYLRTQGEEHAQKLQLWDVQLKAADALGDMVLARDLAAEAAAYHQAHNDPAEWNKTWSNLAITLRNNGQYQQALALMNADSIQWEPNYNNLENLGVLLAIAGDRERSDSAFRAALSVTTADRYKAKVHAWMARNAMARRDLNGAQDHLNEAVALFHAHAIPATDLRSNGTLLNRLNGEWDIVLQVQAEIDMERYRASGEERDREQALAMLDSLQDQLDLLLRSGFASPALQGRYEELQAMRLSAMDQADLAAPDRQQQLLSAMESMRSRGLRNTLLRNSFSRKQGLQAYDSLAAHFHARVMASNKALHAPSPAEYADLTEEMARLHQEDQRMRTNLALPGVSDDGPWARLGTIQEQVHGAHTHVISYLQTDDALRILLVGPEGTSDLVRPITRSRLDSLVARLDRDMTKGGDALEITHELSGILIPEALSGGGGELLVLADGSIDQVPFELLFAGIGGERMVDHWGVHYGYSFQQAFTVEQGRGEGLASFAPSYGPLVSDRSADGVAHDRWLFTRSADAKRRCVPLLNNSLEADAIASMFDEDPVLGVGATEAAFREQVRGRRVVHFAGHAFALPTDPLLSGLVLSDGLGADPISEVDSFDPSFFQDDGVLHAFEIQDMDLPVDLVVLSACHSGTGARQAGEGTLSLARAFMLAGARNVIMSLWKVDDLATKQIMIKFYEKLADGLGKADALAEAKRWYRTEYPNEPPSKWAAFILIGDNEPVQLRRRSPMLPWAVGGGVAVIAAAAMARRRRKRRVGA